VVPPALAMHLVADAATCIVLAGTSHTISGPAEMTYQGRAASITHYRTRIMQYLVKFCFSFMCKVRKFCTKPGEEMSAKEMNDDFQIGKQHEYLELVHERVSPGRPAGSVPPDKPEC